MEFTKHVSLSSQAIHNLNQLSCLTYHMSFTSPNVQPESSRPRKNDDREVSGDIDIPDTLLSSNLFPDLG